MNKIIKVVGAILAGVLLLYVGFQWGANSVQTSDGSAGTTNFGGDFQADSLDSLGLTTNGGDGINSLAGTTTIEKSPDGFVLWDDFTVGTTTPVRGALTNNGSPLMCDGKSLYVYSDATAAFAPSFKFTVGTTTSATDYSANIVASTTVATTTDTVNNGGGWNFLLANGASITLSVGDYSAAIASSTYYGNWSGQFGVHCWTLGQ